MQRALVSGFETSLNQKLLRILRTQLQLPSSIAAKKAQQPRDTFAKKLIQWTLSVVSTGKGLSVFADVHLMMAAVLLQLINALRRKAAQKTAMRF